MQNQENAIPTIRKQTPWNKGKLTGAKPPLRPKHVWSIQTKLQIEGRLHSRPPCAVSRQLSPPTRRPGGNVRSGVFHRARLNFNMVRRG